MALGELPHTRALAIPVWPGAIRPTAWEEKQLLTPPHTCTCQLGHEDWTTGKREEHQKGELRATGKREEHVV